MVVESLLTCSCYETVGTLSKERTCLEDLVAVLTTFLSNVPVCEDHTYSATNDENSFLLTPNPLHHLVGALRQSVPASARASHAVQLEYWRYPS